MVRQVTTGHLRYDAVFIVFMLRTVVEHCLETDAVREKLGKK